MSPTARQPDAPRARRAVSPMVLPHITRSSMLLRLLCGLWLVGAALAAGFLARSPWIVLPLGAAFTVLFIAGKWSAWRFAVEERGWSAVPLGLLSAVPVQCGIVGLFYGLALGATRLAGGRPIAPFADWDLKYAGTVLAVGGALAMAAHLLESRANASDDILRGLLEQDESLPDELREQILGSDRDA